MLANVHTFLGGIAHLWDSLLGIITSDTQLKMQISFVIAALSGVGILHLANVGAFADSLYAVLVLVAQLGLALERLKTSAK